MGIRSKVAMLPAAVRAELDRRIVERAFSGYQALAEWLQAQGYRIADDSVQRYGARLRRQREALDLARHHARRHRPPHRRGNHLERLLSQSSRPPLPRGQKLGKAQQRALSRR
jgi:Protein of unknown function (DUF3486)